MITKECFYLQGYTYYQQMIDKRIMEIKYNHNNIARLWSAYLDIEI